MDCECEADPDGGTLSLEDKRKSDSHEYDEGEERLGKGDMDLVRGYSEREKKKD